MKNEENKLSDSILKLKQLQIDKKKRAENSVEFFEILQSCMNEKLTEKDAEFLVELYSSSKNLSTRNIILKILVWYEQYNLESFFLQAFKKERYLDMRLWAIRGYANYATETEVEKLMSKFHEILVKRPENTPYNYQEYEQIRSVFGLPYLIERFGYPCFIKAYEQEEQQYNAMPDAFKGYFTLDDKGNHVSLKTSEEIDKLWNDFYNKKD